MAGASQTDSELVVRARGVGKRFAVSRSERNLSRALLRLPDGARDDWRWALRGVDLDVHRGEALGVIGANGSGKTTLLSILAGVTAPTEGEVAVRGRVSPLLELGVGFERDMTVREAVVVGAILAGTPPGHARAGCAEVLAFAELADRELSLVRQLSSGMLARLTFANGVAGAPDLLLVDEILAVGDEAFRAKCEARIAELRVRGTTVVSVSHDLAMVARTCTRVARLDGGRLVEVGEPAAVVAGYTGASRSR